MVSGHYLNRAKIPAVQYGERRLNELEVQSIRAVIAYVANDQTTSDVTVREILGARFGTTEVSELRQKDYDEVIQFLVDLNIKEMLN